LKVERPQTSTGPFSHILCYVLHGICASDLQGRRKCNRIVWNNPCLALQMQVVRVHGPRYTLEGCGRGRAKHDYRDIGYRTIQETESRKPEPSKRIEQDFELTEKSRGQNLTPPWFSVVITKRAVQSLEWQSSCNLHPCALVFPYT